MSPKLVTFLQKEMEINSEFYFIVSSLWKKLETLRSAKKCSFVAYTAK